MCFCCCCFLLAMRGKRSGNTFCARLPCFAVSLLVLGVQMFLSDNKTHAGPWSYRAEIKWSFCAPPQSSDKESGRNAVALQLFVGIYCT